MRLISLRVNTNLGVQTLANRTLAATTASADELSWILEAANAEALDFCVRCKIPFVSLSIIGLPFPSGPAVSQSCPESFLFVVSFSGFI